MAPQREGDPKARKAFQAMKRLGIDVETVKPVLKRLLKLYNGKWELIEEDNYRTLADSIFEYEEDKLKAEENGNMINEDIEPPLKKQYRGNPGDRVSSSGDKGKGIADLEEGEVPKSSNEKHPSTQPTSGAHYANSLVRVRREMARDHENRSAIEPREKQPIDNSPQFASPTSPGNNIHHLQRSTSESAIIKDHPEAADIRKRISSGSGSSISHGQVRREMTRDHENRIAIEPSEKQPIDNSPQFASPTSPGNNIHRLQRSTSDSIRKDHPEAADDTGNRISSGSSSSVSHGQLIVAAYNDKKRVFHKVNDITKGTEKVQISLLDEIGNEDLPQFIYCPENITYESAYVHVSLARIADDECCSDCIGDCLSSSIPCACARETGGEFAYTPEGLLNENFLESCILMKQSPKTEHMFRCKDCPLERAKNRPGKCTGHILRKFIKECWRKCGCNMQCGNRVVQRGIARKLQVFLTSEGKGWGLRTLEELPKGAFVCEYVGEILTNIELYERNMKYSGKAKHVYPVLLDADWATEGNLKDEDALCLDATLYGNVARFINHRCHDGNLIEIPVQVETPDRHYYHLAFFTKRKVDAFEELTWDYMIDFDDNTHPVKAFNCRCGSLYCRNPKWKR